MFISELLELFSKNESEPATIGNIKGHFFWVDGIVIFVRIKEGLTTLAKPIRQLLLSKRNESICC